MAGGRSLHHAAAYIDSPGCILCALVALHPAMAGKPVAVNVCTTLHCVCCLQRMSRDQGLVDLVFSSYLTATAKHV